MEGNSEQTILATYLFKKLFSGSKRNSVNIIILIDYAIESHGTNLENKYNKF